LSTNEAELLQAVLHGDKDAFTAVVEEYQVPVYNLCYRMLGNSQAAEDAAQETFWRAYRNINRYDPKRSFATWLLSIAAHYCIDQQRRRRLPTFNLDEILEMETGVSDPGPSPEAVTIKKEEEERIQGYLQMLNPTDRAVLILCYFYEFSEEQICKILEISKSAAKSRLHRARLHIAEIMMNQPVTPMKGRQHETQPI